MSEAVIHPITATDLARLEPLYIDTDGPKLSFLASIVAQPTTYGWHLDNNHGEPRAAVWFTVVAGEADVIDVLVARACRGRGWGGQLLGYALAWLAGQGVTRCHLEVRASNAPALALYDRLGFEQTGKRHNYYRVQGGYEDAILMTLELNRHWTSA